MTIAIGVNAGIVGYGRMHDVGSRDRLGACPVPVVLAGVAFLVAVLAGTDQAFSLPIKRSFRYGQCRYMWA